MNDTSTNPYDMKKINHKSDFDFILRLKSCNGEEIGWPEFDWTARFWTFSMADMFVASCHGGECLNCFNDDGQIHVVAAGHGLGPGVLHVEFYAELPDDIYPVGRRREVTPWPLGIELVRKAGDCPTKIETEMLLPYILAEIPQYGAVEFVTGEAVYRVPICAFPAERSELPGTGYHGYGYGGGDDFTIGTWDL